MKTQQKPKVNVEANGKLTISHLLNPKEQKELVYKTNSCLLQLVRRLSDEPSYSVPVFSSDSLFGTSDNRVQFNTDTIVASTIVGRIQGKFEQPDHTSKSRLTSACYRDWEAYESELSSIKWGSLSNRDRANTYEASREFQRIVGSFGRFVHLMSEQAPTLGPGETFQSKEGDVSAFSKLNDIWGWTVSTECAPYAALIIAQNRGFRQILIEKFFKKKKYQSGDTKARRVTLDPIYSKYAKNVGYFATRVLHEFFYQNADTLIVRGARASSVYKNRVERRGINVEPFWDVILEKMAGDTFRLLLKEEGIDLNHRQLVHRYLISINTLSTVDFKKASDSILVWLVNKLAGHELFAFLQLFRAQMVLIPGYDQMPARWFLPNKFSSMGNGLTFELLTLVILSFARSVDKTASVYGDDLICNTDDAEEICSRLRAVGFNTNPKKTFIAKPLRESCGGYFLQDYGYIRCYDIKWCYNLADVVNTANKLSRIIDDNPKWSHPVKDLLKNTWDQILDGITPALMGPRSSLEDLPAWIEHPAAVKRQRSSKICKQIFTEKQHALAKELTHRWQLNAEDGRPQRYSITSVPVLPKQIKVKAVKNKDVKSLALMYAYLKDCRVIDMLYRMKEPSSVVTFDTLFVFEDGMAIRASNAGRIINERKPSKPKRRKTKVKNVLSFIN